MIKFFKRAFKDMKESAKAQHEVDKAEFEAKKAESRANFEENRGCCVARYPLRIAHKIQHPLFFTFRY
jgi:hypothetical protein